MMVKHALMQYKKLMELTGKEYQEEINTLLDQLEILIKIEKMLSKKKQ